MRSVTPWDKSGGTRLCHRSRRCRARLLVWHGRCALLAGFHASQNVASSRVLAKTGFHYDHDTVLHRFDGTEVPCLAWYLLNPGSQKSDEPAAAAPAVQAEPTEPAENAETTV